MRPAIMILLLSGFAFSLYGHFISLEIGNLYTEIASLQAELGLHRTALKQISKSVTTLRIIESQIDPELLR